MMTLLQSILPLQVQLPSVDEEAIKAHTDSTKAVLHSFAETLANDPQTALHHLGQDAIQFGLKVLAALAIYFVGAWLIRMVKKWMARIFERKKTDKAMASFINSSVSITLTIILIVVVVGTLGINTTSLAALLAAGGMAIGMALSGTLQNFAGGLMIMAFKPFKAGDYIEALGYGGIVTSVSITHTHLTTTDNRRIILPNGALSGGNIANFSSFGLRRVDIPVSVEYGTDAAACKAKLLEIMNADKRILTAKQKGAADPFVALQGLGESSVDFIVRAWVKTADYWTVRFDLTESIYTELPKAGIQFPFPQMDVHLHQN